MKNNTISLGIHEKNLKIKAENIWKLWIYLRLFLGCEDMSRKKDGAIKLNMKYKLKKIPFKVIII